MAKTKGSNPPETEYAYTDAAGVLHYFGEFYRMIFGEGSVSPSDPETDITGQTRRGERPSQQGEGTETQKFYRKAFKDCTMLWNSLPEVCPDPVGDPPETSKKSVWDAKLKFGVVCSYYDLFLRCCINWAKWHAGEMPNGDCFPCISPCSCTDISIGYTTQGMQVNEEQTLSVVGAIEGCIYNWEITVGGGSLSSGSGISVVYTAPATNPECVNNPTITLGVGGVVCDTLEMAINAVTYTYAYLTNFLECQSGEWCPPYEASPGRSCLCPVYDIHGCDGTYTQTNSYVDYWQCGCTGLIENDPCVPDCEVIDSRSAARKTAGCCPAALL